MIRFLQSENRGTKLLIFGIIVISCVAMVLFLIPGFMSDQGTATGGVLVKVGDESIATSEVQTEAQNVQQQRHFPEMLMPYIYQQVSQELVQRSALTYEAHRLGLRVSDQEIQDELRENPQFKQAFFPNGQWIGMDKYKQEVATLYNMSPEQFERAIRTQLLLRKLEALVTGGVGVSDDDAYQVYKEQFVKVKFRYALLTAQDLAKSANPSDAELKKYFEVNKAAFASAAGEKREVKYVVIDRSKVEGNIKVNDDDVRRYYGDHKDEYKVQDEVSLHLIRVTPAKDAQENPTPAGDAAAKQKADEALKQLRAGTPFEKVAKQFSDDPSKDQGGEIGWLERGRAPELDAQLFSLAKGQTSDVIKTGSAYFIVRVDDKHTAHTPTFDEIKSQLEPAVHAMKIAQALNTLDRTVESQARTSGGLAAAAQKNGLQVLDSGLVSRTDVLPGVGTSPAFMEAAFTAEANSPPESVATPQGYVVFVVSKIEPPKPPTFEEVRAQVVGQFKAMQGQRLLQAKLQELADKAHSEHDLARAAREVGATLKTSELVTPQQQVPDIGSLQNAAEIFDLAPGQISGPIPLQGSGIVVDVLEKQVPPRSDFEAKKDQVRDQIVQRKRNQVLQLYLANLMKQLEKDGKIKWNDQEKNSLMKTRAGI